MSREDYERMRCASHMLDQALADIEVATGIIRKARELLEGVEPVKPIAEQIIEIKRAKTQAERARAYRERKKQQK